MIDTITYPTLDGALSDIAERSFYDDATVRRTAGGYAVTADCSAAEECLRWSYAGGIELPDDTADNTRAYEPYECITTAAQMRYALSSAVELIEAGHAVSFQYVILEADPVTAEDIADDEAGLYDGVVGWAIIARNYGAAE